MNLKPESDYYDYFKQFVILLEKKLPKLLPKQSYIHNTELAEGKISLSMTSIDISPIYQHF